MCDKRKLKVKMKKLRILLVAICAVASLAYTYAQQNIISVDWLELQTLVEKNPKYVKSLVKRMSADQTDTTMTWQERITAFYGQAFISADTEESLVIDAEKEYQKKNYEKAVKFAKKALDINPLNIKALKIMSFGTTKLSRDEKFAKKYAKNVGQTYYNRMLLIFNTIAKTGNGSEEKPYFVTKLTDEYEFMYLYLEIRKGKGPTRYKNIDRYLIEEGSDYYTDEELHFEITRVLELEIERYTNKV